MIRQSGLPTLHHGKRMRREGGGARVDSSVDDRMFGALVKAACWCVALVVAVLMTSTVHAMSLDEVFKQPELQERKIIRDTVGRWFLAEDFASIENLEDTARRGKLRTSSGLWVAGLVYGGIDDVASYRKATRDKDWDRLESIARRWITAYPASVTAKIAYGQILQNRAWLYRGGGYADTVSDKQFAAFYKQTEAAKQYEVSNRSLMITDPNGYELLLQTLRLEHDGRREQFEKTFADAIRAFPDYYPIYFEAVTYYLPKWKGDVLQVEKFARHVMQSRDERTGDMLYTRIYWYTSENQFKDGIFLVTVARWRDMRKGFEAIVADFPDQWNINNYARFACLVVDQDTTKKAFDMMKGDPIEKAWASTAQYQQCEHFAGRISL
jgi:hypothetical protein